MIRLFYSYFKTKLIVEGLTQDESDAAHSDLSTAFKDYVVRYDETPWLNTLEKMDAFRCRQPDNFQRKLDDALKTIDDVLDQYRYVMRQLFLKFNLSSFLIFNILNSFQFFEKGKVIEFFQLRAFVTINATIWFFPV